jgi:hypothetical protein
MGRRKLPERWLPEQVIAAACNVFGIDVTEADLVQLAARCRTGEGEFLRYQTNRLSVWRQPHGSSFVTVLYSKRNKCVVGVWADEQ